MILALFTSHEKVTANIDVMKAWAITEGIPILAGFKKSPSSRLEAVSLQGGEKASSVAFLAQKAEFLRHPSNMKKEA